MSGTLYGLGIGPGDPDLITLKALKIMQAAPVIAYPAPVGKPSLARSIVETHLPGNQLEIKIDTPMVPGKFPANDVYDQYSEEIAKELELGKDVAVLCEGDPFFFGSFMYIYARLSERFKTVVVPGVSSAMASCCQIGVPITSRDDVLSVLPAPLPSEELMSRLQQCDAAIIMKVGRHFTKVRDVLGTLGLSENAFYIEHATMDNQKIMPLDEAQFEKAPYFSMIIVHKRGEAWK
ncbi:Precorrin-2 C(20)-methyltransferase [Candidatus Terasakiella magnetica]|uniref:Precorrin-2 C(20)-methyltransferase n=1 Tax=Candidatus Terasakiella magnetica TaxID=1867952 RepID=A0A1C3RJB8_9PROT|nr:precorrin-2 C(20)-methyltransferase [Candidatus Terasakiella magnetica]SCA57362.1 Precorrin-2 C(20)-methyltransferase [Candidatus Terasakiella magnetica]